MNEDDVKKFTEQMDVKLASIKNDISQLNQNLILETKILGKEVLRLRNILSQLRDKCWKCGENADALFKVEGEWCCRGCFLRKVN